MPVMAKEDCEPYKAALLLNGTLGDKSFYDSANAGLEALQEELGDDKFTFKVEQMGATSADEAKWEPTMYDYCDDGSYDVIICGTYQMLDALTNAAADYPDQKFIFFDEAFDFILFQIQQVLLTAVAAVGSHCLQCIAKRIPVLF